MPIARNFQPSPLDKASYTFDVAVALTLPIAIFVYPWHRFAPIPWTSSEIDELRELGSLLADAHEKREFRVAAGCIEEEGFTRKKASKVCLEPPDRHPLWLMTSLIKDVSFEWRAYGENSRPVGSHTCFPRKLEPRLPRSIERRRQ